MNRYSKEHFDVIKRMFMHQLINTYPSITHKKIISLGFTIFPNEIMTDKIIFNSDQYEITQDIKDTLFNLVSTNKISPVIFAFLIMFGIFQIEDLPNFIDETQIILEILRSNATINVKIKNIIFYNKTRLRTNIININNSNIVNNINIIDTNINTNIINYKIINYFNDFGLIKHEPELEPETELSECMICCSDISDPEAIFSCHTCHKLFHIECMSIWFAHSQIQSCPHCRSNTSEQCVSACN